MGQSSSSSSTANISPAQREAESSAAATGALPTLQKAFSLLSDPQTNTIPLDSLEKCFALTIENPTLTSDEAITVPKDFLQLLSDVGSSIVEQFFTTGNGVLDWIKFLTGYNKCCGRTVASTSFNNLFKVFAKANEKAGLPAKLKFDYSEDDSKMDGVFYPTDLVRLLWMCDVLSWDSGKLRDRTSTGTCVLPDIDNLVFSALDSCADEPAEKLDIWNSKVSDLKVQLPAAKVHMWALKTVPCLADCLAHFVYTRLIYLTNQGEKVEGLCFPVPISPSPISKTNLLSCGSAWAISLTLRSSITDEISKLCFDSDAHETNENLLYRSSFHGKGLNRFWSHVEGYNGPVLMLIAASEVSNESRSWIIGALTHQGFENRDTFYGHSGSLYAISPVFNTFPSSGKEKNFVYSHLHPTGRLYEAHPKPVGIAFGGSVGNERIFLDEDFGKVIVRHHAFDKTYQPGPLVPGQGFLPLEGSVVEVEAWGLGGKTAKEIQNSYKKREELFNEQRRKVDLKTFASWEDSPEKMMMDMMSDPNAVRREDR